MKTLLSGRRLVIIAAVFALLTAVAFTLPAFLFNEMEFKSRSLIQLAFYTDYSVDEMIEISSFRKPVALSSKDRAELPDEIERGIKAITAMLQDSLSVTENQQKIPLLPKKYREYAQMKADFLRSYIGYYETFLTVKEIEFRGRRIAEQLDANQRHMRQLNEAVDFFEAAGASGLVGQEVQSSAERMYADGELSQGLHDYYLRQAQNQVELAEYFLDEEKDWEHTSGEQIAREVGEILSQGSEVDPIEQIQGWHTEIIDPIKEEANGHEDAALEKMNEAGIYYMDKDLDKDPITHALSLVFKNKYPKNRRVEVD